MLVLTRKPGESIHIFPQPDLDPNMTVAELFAEGALVCTVNRSPSGDTRIGITAPEALTILREELIDFATDPAVTDYI